MANVTEGLVNGSSEPRRPVRLRHRRANDEAYEAQTNQGNRKPNDLRQTTGGTVAVQIGNQKPGIPNLESNHRIRAALDVDTVDKANVL